MFFVSLPTPLVSAAFAIYHASSRLMSGVSGAALSLFGLEEHRWRKDIAYTGQSFQLCFHVRRQSYDDLEHDAH